MTDGDREQRRLAARTLFEQACGDAQSLDGHLSPLAAHLGDDDPLVRGHLVAAVGMASFAIVEYDQPKPYLDVLLDRLTDPDSTIRQSVLGVLWNRPDDRLWESPAVYDDGDRIRTLAAVGFATCLEDDTDVVRRRASDHISAELVCDHPDPESAVVVLFDRLDDDQGTVRRAAADCIVDLARGEPALVRPYTAELLDRIDGDDDPVRLRAAEALVAFEDHDVSETVATELVDMLTGERKQRQRAIEALQAVTERSPALVDQTFDVLVTQLGTFDFDVRGTAATSLARLADRYPEQAPDPALTLASLDNDEPYDAKGVFPLALIANECSAFVGDRLADAAHAVGRGEYDGHVTGLIIEQVAGENPAALDSAADAFGELLGNEDDGVREIGVKLVSTLAVERPSAAEPLVDEFVATLDKVRSYECSVATEGLLSLAIWAPDILCPHADRIADLVLSFEDARSKRRHNAAVALARLAEYDPTCSPDLGKTLASHLQSKHPDRSWEFDRFVYITGYDRKQLEDPFPRTDIAWPLGVVADDRPGLIDTSALADLPDRDDRNQATAEIATLIVETAAGSVQVVEPLLDRLVDDLLTDPGYNATQYFVKIARKNPQVLASYAEDIESASKMDGADHKLTEVVSMIDESGGDGL
ncbi:hypothetical protein OB920_00065 [Halobacteria archaeon HArc-gm2]|nr:hypothetical protein [Halobacteria archaeon HArc-gm2]